MPVGCLKSNMAWAATILRFLFLAARFWALTFYPYF